LKATNAEMLVMTIPDPFDTPYFTPLPGVTRLSERRRTRYFDLQGQAG